MTINTTESGTTVSITTTFEGRVRKVRYTYTRQGRHRVITHAVFVEDGEQITGPLSELMRRLTHSR